MIDTWDRAWAEFTPFLAFPVELRTIVYTTNAIEALNRQLRKVLKTKGALPSDEAASKLAWTRTLDFFELHLRG